MLGLSPGARSSRMGRGVGKGHLQQHLPGSSSAPLPGPALPHGPCQRWPPAAHWGERRWQSGAACEHATRTGQLPSAARAVARRSPPHHLPRATLLTGCRMTAHCCTYKLFFTLQYTLMNTLQCHRDSFCECQYKWIRSGRSALILLSSRSQS